MAVDSLKSIFLAADINYALKHGGLTARERSALAERFRVSEEVLVRFESALCAFNSWSSKQRSRASAEAMRRMNQLGKEIPSPEFWDEFRKVLDRIRAEAKENEIIRELDEATAALNAALDASMRSKAPQLN